MSKNAPDFSGSFELVQDQLTETERRLRSRKRNLNQGPESASSAETDVQIRDESGNRQIDVTSPFVFEAHPAESDQATSPASINRQREQRRNLTLKVLESNEAKFNQLFHRLRLAGDLRRKQDLADEALELLFASYREQC